MKPCCILPAIIALVLASPTQAESNLGIVIQQGDNGHPVVVEVFPQVGNYTTLGAYLQLEPGDEIYRAHSDPIRLSDGTVHQTWKILSIADLRWVLARTHSRIGLTVKRDETYIKAVAVFRLYQEQVDTPRGMAKVFRGRWELDGPQEFDAP